MRIRRLLGSYTRSLYLVGLFALGACSSGQQEDPSSLEQQDSKDQGDDSDASNKAAPNGDIDTQAQAPQDNAMPQNPGQDAAAPAPQAQAMAPQVADAQASTDFVQDNEQSTTGGLETGSMGKEAAPGLPELGAKLSYVVKKGDTLGTISKRIFGTRKKWRSLAKLSNIKNANRIFPGDVVYYQLTEKSLAFAQTYENLHREQTVVAKGETLAKIALRVYGSETEWRHIWRQNDQITVPDHLEEGMKVFYIPAHDLGLKTKMAVGSSAKTFAKNKVKKKKNALLAANDFRGLNGYRAL